MNKSQETKLKRAYVKAVHLLHHFNEKLGPAFSYSLIGMVNSYPSRYLTDNEKLVFFALINVAYGAVPAGPYVAYDSSDLYKATGERANVDKVVASLAAKHFIQFGTMKDGSIFLDVAPHVMIRAILRVPSKYSSIRKMRRFQ